MVLLWAVVVVSTTERYCLQGMCWSAPDGLASTFPMLLQCLSTSMGCGAAEAALLSGAGGVELLLGLAMPLLAKCVPEDPEVLNTGKPPCLKIR